MRCYFIKKVAMKHLWVFIATIVLVSVLLLLLERILVPEITFIIPNGYQGPLEIVEDKVVGKGSNPKRIVFSDSGRACVESFVLFQKTHRLQCRFNDGTVLRQIESGTRDNDIALRFGWLRDSSLLETRVMYFVVGTKEDEDKMRESVHR